MLKLNENIDYSQILKKAREERGLTISQVSKLLDIPYQSIYNCEKSKYNPSLLRFVELMNFYGRNVYLGGKMNKDFQLYLQKYCTKHHLTEEEARKHELVKEVEKLYSKKENEECYYQSNKEQ